jgi:hypothetical protein
MKSDITEFARWRDAPADRRPSIAREQFAHWRSIRGMLPDFNDASWVNATAPNGRRFVDCAPRELGEMAAWLCDIAETSRAVNKAIDLVGMAGAVKI